MQGFPIFIRIKDKKVTEKKNLELLIAEIVEDSSTNLQHLWANYESTQTFHRSAAWAILIIRLLATACRQGGNK